ncbi:hypothetical protein [Actinacidiphila glaucinigra]|uniref:hypothetical protein n=1 Tax=Actinacidiphila glaucinigra TaxID=235986 RepID=UPI0029B3DFC5|nr:hypothetical protein [Streptomyces sp. PA03-3a]
MLPPDWENAGRYGRVVSGVGMENWEFREWQTALGALDPGAAGLVGLAAAERISGCLGDERFLRHGPRAAEAARELLRECWSVAGFPDADGDGGGDGDGSASTRIRDVADELAGHVADYQTLSMTEVFRSYVPLAGDEDEDPGEEAPDLEEFLEEAEPEGAVMMHLDALAAMEEAAAACAGGPWDGALRCLQVTAMAADRHDPRLPGPGAEVRRQREDLLSVREADGAQLRQVAARLRTRAQADAAGWRRATERLGLLHD